VQEGLIPHSRIESNVRFSKHRVREWLEERTFQLRPVNGKGAKANKDIRRTQKAPSAALGAFLISVDSRLLSAQTLPKSPS